MLLQPSIKWMSGIYTHTSIGYPPSPPPTNFVMPKLMLLRLEQSPIFPNDTAHWTLFLPNIDGSSDGDLFHIVKDSFVTAETRYQNRGFSVQESQKLISGISLSEIDVSLDELDQACQRVTRNRTFNIVTNNCQHWVREVVDDLIRVLHLPAIDVLDRMNKAGYKPFW